MKPSAADLALLRHACALAQEARDEGNHPFACILVDPEGNVVIESKNEGHAGPAEHVDRTAHAELLMARKAATLYRPEELQSFTMYSSAEPCCMCAGSLYWAGVGRIVFAMTEHELLGITGANAENPTLDLPCREVFAHGQREIEVIGPIDIPEAIAVHEGFWE